jgi:predicted CXXCH cytochrome family protein
VTTCLGCHDEVGEAVMASHSHLTRKSGNSCVNCHSPHAGNTNILLRGNQVQVCSKCHADTLEKRAVSLFNHTEKVMVNCNECHGVHGSDRYAMLKADANETCLRCHEGQGQFSHPVGEDIRDPRTGQAMTCLNCHSPHGTDYKGQLLLDGAEALCVQCHSY